MHSKPFWIASMKDPFNVDSDGLYERVASQAQEISRSSNRDAVSLDKKPFASG